MKKQKTDLITIRCTKDFKDTLSKKAAEHSQTLSTYILNQLTDNCKTHFTRNIIIKQELLEDLDRISFHTTNSRIKEELKQMANKIMEEL